MASNKNELIKISVVGFLGGGFFLGCDRFTQFLTIFLLIRNVYGIRRTVSCVEESIIYKLVLVNGTMNHQLLKQQRLFDCQKSQIV